MLKILWQTLAAAICPSQADVNRHLPHNPTVRLTGAPSIGCASVVASARARLDSSKLFSACLDHTMGLLPLFAPFNVSFNGCNIFAGPGMKRR